MLKKRAARRAASRTHRQMMDAARHVLGRHVLEDTVPHVDPAEVVALVFGRHALRITEQDAIDYLNALFAERGFPLHTTPAPAVDVVDRAGRDRARCPAAPLDDKTPYGGPHAVMVLDATNRGAEGCEHHAAQLLALLDDGHVYALPEAPEGAALRVFKAAGAARADTER
ncbi:hypothetical protein AB0E08_11000 [Streptomyces sp. NPDC048281]|uniref:hypothetical protein n=1 Tax=Streptomyces sp. NPDC048281 TaxID=3154715 RepID=UPI00343668F3